jgi:purine-binding chemotaxis protein CheW
MYGQRQLFSKEGGSIMSVTLNNLAKKTADNLEGKYLTFVLGNESYGVAVLKIREIIRLCHITPMPQMPDYIMGVINLRGKIIPVLDLRRKFRLSNVQDSERTCIVVVQIRLPANSSVLMGLIVDAVEEVVNLSQTDIEPAPDFGGVVDTHYILGMAKIKGSVKTLLDIGQIVEAEGQEAIQQAIPAIAKPREAVKDSP